MAQTAREFSAGGVVVRHKDGQWWVAVIRPTGREASKKKSAKGKITQAAKPVLTLPKGLIDPGEKPEETAVREIQEEIDRLEAKGPNEGRAKQVRLLRRWLSKLG